MNNDEEKLRSILQSYGRLTFLEEQIDRTNQKILKSLQEMDSETVHDDLKEILRFFQKSLQNYHRHRVDQLRVERAINRAWYDPTYENFTKIFEAIGILKK